MQFLTHCHLSVFNVTVLIVTVSSSSMFVLIVTVVFFITSITFKFSMTTHEITQRDVTKIYGLDTTQFILFIRVDT